MRGACTYTCRYLEERTKWDIVMRKEGEQEEEGKEEAEGGTDEEEDE